MSLALFLPLFLAILALSIYAANRVSTNVHSTKDFFLANRSLGPLALATTLLATQLGGGAVLGGADEGYRQGWVALFYSFGQAFGLLALAAGIGKRLHQTGVSTVSELLYVKYDSKTMQKVAGALSVGALFLILVAQGIAARKLLVSMQLPDWVFGIGWIAMVGYTVMGGLGAVVVTDAVQVVVILLILGVCVFFTGLPSWELIQAAPKPNGEINVSSWLILPFFFTFIEQDIAQRCFSGSGGKAVSKAMGMAAIALILSSTLPVYFGVLGAVNGVSIAEGESVFMATIGSLCPWWVTSLAAIALMMAILSTTDSLLCAASSNLAFDFGKEGSLKSAKLATLALGIGAFALSYTFTSVYGMLMFAYQLAVSGLTVPVLMGVFAKRPNRLAAWSALIVGSVTLPLDQPLASLGLSLTAYLLVSTAVPAQLEDEAHDST